MEYLIDNKKYSTSMIFRLCCPAIGLKMNCGIKALASKIKQDLNYTGNDREVILEFATKCKASGNKFIIPEGRKVRMEKVKSKLNVGKKFSRENIKTQNTPACKKMSQILDRLNLKYSREHPFVCKRTNKTGGLKTYIVDFYIPHPVNIAIELDGAGHFTEKGFQYDKKRDTEILSEKRCFVIRFENKVVLDENFDLISHLKSFPWFKQRMNKLSAVMYQ